MTRKVFVAGAGMIPFKKPGTSDTYDVMGATATRQALADAGVDYNLVQQAYVGYVYGDSTCGQKALYDVGMSGIPVINVNNNCATGSSALFLARQAVASGTVECALALGFEYMGPGALKSVWTDRASALERALNLTDKLVGKTEGMSNAIRQFAGAGQTHMRKYGTKLETFAKIRAKASRHAANNPLAVFRTVVSTEDVMNAPMLWDGVLTRLMACPPTCGAAAAIVVSEDFARKHGLRTDVLIAAQSLTTDRASSYESDMIRLVGFDMTREGARQVYEQAGIGPQDVDVIELHDCFAQNELLTYEGLGLCDEGCAEKLVNDGDNTYGGKWVVNPSGGLLSKGHPLGATGLAQCYEMVQQLRGNADQRQVAGARNALTHNLGLGGACVVTLYQKHD
ncbi:MULTISPECIES: lipid-transfer protein [Cupriavidus]|jgi:acetyl-CoA acetyltransferase|uniref:propanoyl-CoA C-acyltransferase n=1 Tax=Cupriavidus metallidurans TaxID=119219 RepID=A0A482IZE4_9BURK|nr:MULTISPECIES: lipid-transfer protein [Cupriavidus]KWR81632.1 lipid-transfer protein [Cupriavidus sp. SHE]QBP12953.1 lipid-transfer protein [Cupriavidus metallidurans]QWC90745.1 lipid-transfer protein [Cupriavidus metallidurans]